MAPAPAKPGKQGGGDEGRAMSNNLWVGNIGRDVTDSDLYDLFSQYGALDGVTSYSTRSYAFVLFKRKEEAAAAKEALQGTPVRGLPIKIEFARPVRIIDSSLFISVHYHINNYNKSLCEFVEQTSFESNSF